jgi:hypothetical protein
MLHEVSEIFDVPCVSLEQLNLGLPLLKLGHLLDKFA